MFEFVLLISLSLSRVFAAYMYLPRPEILVSSVEMSEYRRVWLECTVPKSVPTPLKWTWNCAGKSMPNSMDNTRRSNLTFTVTRHHDKTNCYCRAQSESANVSYDKTSAQQTITVTYQPRDNPILVTESPTSLTAGHDFIFNCRISTMGNPPMFWSWKCGERMLSNGQMSNFGNTSKIEFAAESWQNGKSCFCEASSTKYTHNLPSKKQNVTVYYAPVDFPELLSKTDVHVEENLPIILRCCVSLAGNPRLYWSWYCGDNVMEKGASFGDTWSELTFIASKQYHQKACYCRLRSKADLVSYDKTSQKIFITIKSDHTCFSTATFVTTTSVLSTFLVIVSLIILIKTVRKRPINLQRWIHFHSLLKNPRCTAPPQPKVRQNDDRTITFIEDHTYEVVKSHEKKKRKGKKKRSPIYANVTQFKV